jgi:hypothetical protein
MCHVVLLSFWLLLLLSPQAPTAQEPRLVVTLPCTVGWILPDARQVNAFRLWRDGRVVRRVDVPSFPGWAQLYQASCERFGLTPGDHAIAVSAITRAGVESPRSPTLWLDVR